MICLFSTYKLWFGRVAQVKNHCRCKTRSSRFFEGHNNIVNVMSKLQMRLWKRLIVVSVPMNTCVSVHRQRPGFSISIFKLSSVNYIVTYFGKVLCRVIRFADACNWNVLLRIFCWHRIRISNHQGDVESHYDQSSTFHIMHVDTTETNSGQSLSVFFSIAVACRIRCRTHRIESRYGVLVHINLHTRCVRSIKPRDVSHMHSHHSVSRNEGQRGFLVRSIVNIYPGSHPLQ